MWERIYSAQVSSFPRENLTWMEERPPQVGLACVKPSDEEWKLWELRARKYRMMAEEAKINWWPRNDPLGYIAQTARKSQWDGPW